MNQPMEPGRILLERIQENRRWWRREISTLPHPGSCHTADYDDDEADEDVDDEDENDEEQEVVEEGNRHAASPR